MKFYLSVNCHCMANSLIDSFPFSRIFFFIYVCYGQCIFKIDLTIQTIYTNSFLFAEVNGHLRSISFLISACRSDSLRLTFSFHSNNSIIVYTRKLVRVRSQSGSCLHTNKD